MIKKSFLFLMIIFFISCQSNTKYITIPLTRPPARFEINEITNNQQALLEYRKATMHIARWQNWYNSQVGTNYYNYRDITNIKVEYTNSTNLIVFTNTITITNELLITNTNEIRN